MLDHDQLLPEEQANPALVRELRSAYQVTPKEQQVLARVHERLAKHSSTLSLHDEPVRVGEYSRPLQLVPPVSSLAQPIRLRQRWLRHLNTLAGLLFLVLLVGSLVFAFSVARRNASIGSSSTTKNDIRVMLVPVETFGMYSQQAMQGAATILSQRFINFGLQGSSVRVQMVKGQLGIVAELPRFGGNEQQTTSILLELGTLGFWDTGPSSNPNAILVQGTTFNPGQYTQYNPGGQPLFTNRDLDSTALSVIIDPQSGHPFINGMMKGGAIGRFALFTAKNVGHALTITLDGKVVSSAFIASQITGPFEITGKFTQQQANAIVSILKETPLPFALKEVK